MASSSSEDERSKSDALQSAASSTEDQLNKSDASEVVTSRQTEHKPKRSFLGRIWSTFSIFGHLFYSSSNEDFEKKLKHLSKEEAAAHTRLKRRSQTWTKLARGVIIYSIIVELLLLGIAVIMTRTPELSWQMRALRVLPVFAFPALASLVYSTCASYYRMCERKDQKTLDRLRNERKAKIDELKERTNYYLTQQLIHKYDSDPAAKEAAARVLASKLGADAGLALSLEPSSLVDGNKHALSETRRQNVEPLDTTGLRRRVRHQSTPSTGQSFFPPGQAIDETAARGGGLYPGEQAMEMEQITSKINVGSGGWVARLAAMLVGEDPTQCYALICKNCHMHNGLARKEDFQYVAYYCPHCHGLNESQQFGERAADGSNPLAATPRAAGLQGLNNDDILMASAPLVTGGAINEPDSSENHTTASERSNDISS